MGANDESHSNRAIFEITGDNFNNMKKQSSIRIMALYSIYWFISLEMSVGHRHHHSIHQTIKEKSYRNKSKNTKNQRINGRIVRMRLHFILDKLAKVVVGFYH